MGGLGSLILELLALAFQMEGSLQLLSCRTLPILLQQVACFVHYAVGWLVSESCVLNAIGSEIHP